MVWGCSALGLRIEGLGVEDSRRKPRREPLKEPLRVLERIRVQCSRVPGFGLSGLGLRGLRVRI